MRFFWHFTARKPPDYHQAPPRLNSNISQCNQAVFDQALKPFKPSQGLLPPFCVRSQSLTLKQTKGASSVPRSQTPHLNRLVMSEAKPMQTVWHCSHLYGPRTWTYQNHSTHTIKTWSQKHIHIQTSWKMEIKVVWQIHICIPHKPNMPSMCKYVMCACVLAWLRALDYVVYFCDRNSWLTYLLRV